MRVLCTFGAASTSLLAALPVAAATALIALLSLRGSYGRLRVFPATLVTVGIVLGTRLGGRSLGLGELSVAQWPIGVCAVFIGLTVALRLTSRLADPSRPRAAAGDGVGARSGRAGG
jgi:hypothetical protein